MTPSQAFMFIMGGEFCWKVLVSQRQSVDVYLSSKADVIQPAIGLRPRQLPRSLQHKLDIPPT